MAASASRVRAVVDAAAHELEQPAVRAAGVAAVALEHPASRRRRAGSSRGCSPRSSTGVPTTSCTGVVVPSTAPICPVVVHAAAEQRALRVGAAGEHRACPRGCRSPPPRGRSRDRPGLPRRTASAGSRAGCRSVSRISFDHAPLGDVVEHRLARVRVLRHPRARQQVRDPVVQHEERRDATRVVMLAEPEAAATRRRCRAARVR